MPCCAFAAFIIAQIVLGLDALKRFFFGRGLKSLEFNAATEWRLDAVSMTTSASARRLSPRWFAIAAAIELAIVAGGAYRLRTHFETGAHRAGIVPICRRLIP